MPAQSWAPTCSKQCQTVIPEYVLVEYCSKLLKHPSQNHTFSSFKVKTCNLQHFPDAMAVEKDAAPEAARRSLSAATPLVSPIEPRNEPLLRPFTQSNLSTATALPDNFHLESCEDVVRDRDELFSALNDIKKQAQNAECDHSFVQEEIKALVEIWSFKKQLSGASSRETRSQNIARWARVSTDWKKPRKGGQTLFPNPRREIRCNSETVRNIVPKLCAKREVWARSI